MSISLWVSESEEKSEHCMRLRFASEGGGGVAMAATRPGSSPPVSLCLSVSIYLSLFFSLSSSVLPRRLPSAL